MTVFVSVLVLWVISLCLHEYAHARVAWSGGDTTVADKGYLSLNPLRYIHPMMSIVLPLVILALGGVPLPGGAVWIDHTRLRSRAWEAAVSAAGPATNLLLFILCALAFRLGLMDPEDPTNTLAMTVAVFAYFQALACLLNLLPIPGLDGFGILAPWLPYEARRAAREYANVGFIVLILLMVYDNPLRNIFFEAVLRLVDAGGIAWGPLQEGWREFMSITPFRGG